MDSADTVAVIAGAVGLGTLFADRPRAVWQTPDFPWRAAGVFVAGGVLGGTLAYVLLPGNPVLSGAIGGLGGSYALRYAVAGRTPQPSKDPDWEKPAIPYRPHKSYAPALRLWAPIWQD